MDHTHPDHIDNGDALFQIDLYEPQNPSLEDPASSFATHIPSASASTSNPSLPSLTREPEPEAVSEMHDQESDHRLLENLQDMAHEEMILDMAGRDKGKGVSKPMQIPQYDGASSSCNDPQVRTRSDIILSSSSCDKSFTRSTSMTVDLQSLRPSVDDIYSSLMSRDDDSHTVSGYEQASEDIDGSPMLSDKGKARESPPALPPLSFTPTSFGYSKVDWPSPALSISTPGPSSYGSGHLSILSVDQCTSLPDRTENPATPARPEIIEDTPVITHMPSRRRTLSNLSLRSTLSLAALPMSSKPKVKTGLSKGPGNLARRIFRSRPNSSQSSPAVTPSTELSNPIDDIVEVGRGNCFMPWKNDFKAQKREESGVNPYLGLDVDGVANVDSLRLPLYHNYRGPDGPTLKTKHRSYSYPLPLSALDIVPAVSNDIFVPLPIIVRNWFDHFLPRELRLYVLSHLVASHEADLARMERTGQWSALKATSSKNKWIGREKGLRELVRFSRVSKAWRALVFDGQLWADCDLRGFPKLPTTLLLRLAETAGPFVKSVDLTGHANLLSSHLLAMTASLHIKPASCVGPPCTQLTTLNLQGCSGLTTQSLHNLLSHSPFLEVLCLKGLAVVNNATCEEILPKCPRLTTLNLSRCSLVSARGIRAYATAVLARGDLLLLKDLRLSGLKHINDHDLAVLGKAAPHLEVLDLSYSRSLHNSALAAFVACSDEETETPSITLTAREVGRDLNGASKIRRRVTSLRYLSLSCCSLLTDDACANLAHAVPHLEYLELAGIGSMIQDEGLIRLLDTTPFIRKLDLEDACDITDTVLAALTPSPEPEGFAQGKGTSNAPPQTGHALEHLVVSYAVNLTNEALLALIRNCTRLSVLEADSTNMSGVVMKEFVRLARGRSVSDARIVAVDCRGISESIVKELTASTRPRKGWRSYEARKLAFLDKRDDEGLKVGQDELDEKRVVLKSFYSWQTVDAVRAARDRKRRATYRRVMNSSATSSTSDSEEIVLTTPGGSRARWWSPAGRASGAASPAVNDATIERDGCVIM